MSGKWLTNGDMRNAYGTLVERSKGKEISLEV
jgi:hypothetical protein